MRTYYRLVFVKLKYARARGLTSYGRHHHAERRLRVLFTMYLRFGVRRVVHWYAGVVGKYIIFYVVCRSV